MVTLMDGVGASTNVSASLSESATMSVDDGTLVEAVSSLLKVSSSSLLSATLATSPSSS